MNRAFPRTVIQRYSNLWVVAVALAFCLLGLIGIFAKHDLMLDQWSPIARWYGYLSSSQLSIAQRIPFLFADCFVGFLLLPLIAAVVLGWLPRAIRLGVAALVGSMTYVVIFFEVHSRETVGEYLPVGSLREALTFGAHNLHAATEYLPARALIKVLAIEALFVAILFAGDRLDCAFPAALPRAARCVAKPLKLSAAALLLTVCAAGLAFTAHNEHARGLASLHRSALEMMLAAATAKEGVADPAYANRSYSQMVDAARQFTSTSPPPDTTGYAGSMKNANVILFIVETAPAVDFDLSGDARNWPGVSDLLSSSFVGRTHYTTYPYTSDAVFSVMSGLYPYERRYLLAAPRSQQLPGLLTSLDRDAYSTAVFVPSLLGAEVDDAMYKVFGAEQVYVASADHATPPPDADPGATYLRSWQQSRPLTPEYAAVLTDDDKALVSLEAFIRQNTAAGRPFAAMFLPQASHAPWRGTGSVRERGLQQMRLAAQALAKIVQTLRASQALDNTIIVVTGDHGIRTRVEDPALDAGKATDYSFHVPLLVYCPKTLHSSTPIDVPTSHIDIANTVLALLGDPDASRVGEGVPIWLAQPGRRLFMLGERYGGYNAFEENGAYYMTQLLAGQNYIDHDAMSFPQDDALNPGDPRNQSLDRTFSAFESLQGGFVNALRAH